MDFLNMLPNETYFNFALTLLPLQLNNILRLSSQLYNKIRNDNYFWKTKILYDFGLQSHSQDTYEDYANMFDQNNLSKSLNASARQGHLELLQYIKSSSRVEFPLPMKELMRGALLGNHDHVIEYIIELGFKSWNSGMGLAADANNKKWVDYCISKGANYWPRGIKGASYSNSKTLLEFFIDKGETDWNINMYYATLGGNLEFIQYFISRGANDWDYSLCAAAKYNHKELVDFFIQKGANNLDIALIQATIESHFDMIKYLIHKGATNFNESLIIATQVATQVKDMSIVDYFISVGANDFIGAFREAVSDQCEDLVRMFQIRGNIDIRQQIEIFRAEDLELEADYIRRIYNIKE